MKNLEKETVSTNDKLDVLSRFEKVNELLIYAIMLNSRGQRREDWDKFVKTLERDITGTQRRGFKIFKQLQLQERDKLKIDPITKTEWKEYYGKLWNEQDNKGEEGIEEERRREGTDDNEHMITIEELNEVLKRAKNRKSCGLYCIVLYLFTFHLSYRYRNSHFNRM